ncbi:MAG: M50 family metallopeptidase, partial [bacterium]|nr:M50 family metallopeptidase [bacterium]
KIGETEFSLSAIPLGGYVEIAGALEVGQGEQKEALRTDEYSFRSKPLYQKFCIMIAGIFFNILFAYGALITLYMVGLPKHHLLYPKNAHPIIESILKDSAAQRYGLQKGDRIRAVNDINIDDNVQKLLELVRPYAREHITLIVERNNELVTIDLVTDKVKTPLYTKPVGSLGVIFELIDLPPYPVWKAITEGFSLTNEYIVRTVSGLISSILRKDTSNMVSPVMIISLTSKGAAAGFKVFIIFLVIISIGLGMLNLLPLPIFDGGQILFYTIEAIIRRPLPNYIREYIHIISWILLLLFVLYLSVRDVIHIANPYIESVTHFLGFGK